MGNPLFRNFRPKHIRTRLTLWYVFVLASVLAVTWTFTAFFLFLQLRDQLTHYAVQDIETVEGLLYFDPGGSLTLREDYHNIRIPSACWSDSWKFAPQRAKSSIATSGSPTGRSVETRFPTKEKINFLALHASRRRDASSDGQPSVAAGRTHSGNSPGL